MSLLISEAAGSKEVAAAILKRPGHPDVELMSMKDMPYGDCMLTFHGPGGKTILVGVEIKSWRISWRVSAMGDSPATRRSAWRRFMTLPYSLWKGSGG